MRFLTIGNFLFMLGAALETVGVGYGVHTQAVAWSMIGYSVVLLLKGYLN